VTARQLLLLTWRYRVLVAVCIAVCLTAALILFVASAPTYESRTQLLVSTPATANDVGAAYQGELFAQQRVATYAEMATSTDVLHAVARELGLPEGARALEGRVRATVVPDTALIDVTARSASAPAARAIADALGRELSRFVEALEARGDGRAGPVRLRVTRAADTPASPASPSLKLNLALGLLAGLALAATAVALSAGLDNRVRSDRAIETGLGVPVLGRVRPDGDAVSPVVRDAPFSADAEDYRRLRTQLEGRWGGAAMSSLVVSSLGTGGGTASVVANLALAIAGGGRRVALVDGDAEVPGPTALLGLEPGPGLADVLAGDLALDAALTRLPDLPLAMVRAGRAGPDLLAAPGLPGILAALREHADVVIVAAPELERGADAVSLATVASAVLLVVRLGATAAPELEAAARALARPRGPLLGVVVDRRSRGRPGAGRVSPAPPPAAENARQVRVPSGRRA
jgi:succinoglycan biosynthesis transport protein ExoP